MSVAVKLGKFELWRTSKYSLPHRNDTETTKRNCRNYPFAAQCWHMGTAI